MTVGGFGGKMGQYSSQRIAERPKGRRRRGVTGPAGRLLSVVTLLVAATAATAASASAGEHTKSAPVGSVASVAPAQPGAKAQTTSAGTGYNPLVPARLLDTRPGFTTVDGADAGIGAVGADQSIDVVMTGRGGVPATNVAAVALNVTVTQPTSTSFLTVFPTGTTPRPNASNLNFDAGQTVPNLVIAMVGTGGMVSFYNSAGSTQILADVAGWFAVGSNYSPLAPARLLDTRPGTTTIDGVDAGVGPLGPGATGQVPVTGRGGVPATGVAAVVLNVTATQPTSSSFLTVFPAQATRPTASNLNFSAGQTIPNLVIVKVGAQGAIWFYNNLGTTQLFADVEGWFPIGSDFSSVLPGRLLDTRPGQPTVDNLGSGAGPVGAGQSLAVQVTGRGGVPSANVSAVVLNVTATQPTDTSYATVFPTGSPRPATSNLNFVAGQTIANLVIAKVSPGGQVTLYNRAGTTDFIADVEGWFSTAPPVAVTVAGTTNLVGVACAASSMCVAVGSDSAAHGVAVVVTNGSPAAAQPVPTNNGLGGVACPSATVCEAVGQGPSSVGQVVPITNGVPGTPMDVTGTSSLAGIACPSATLCEAVGSTASPTSQSAAVPIANGTPGTPLLINGVTLVAIACPKATVCQAVGFNSANVGVVVPITNGVPGTAKTVTGTAYLDAIGCRTANVCEAGGATSFNGTGQGVTVLVAAGTPVSPTLVAGTISLDGAACPSTSVCEMGGEDGAGHGLLISIFGATPSAPAGVAGTDFIDGLACPSATTCVGVGQDTVTSAHSGEIVTITAGP